MNYCARLLCLFLSSFALACGQIKQSLSCVELLECINPEKTVWVVCDLDNTLIEPAHHSEWGSDQWFSAHLNRLVSKGHTFEQALEIVLPFYYEIQHHDYFSVKPVEAVTLSVLSEAKQRASRVVGLTARSRPLVDVTVKLLADAGIDFSQHNGCERFEFDHARAVYTHGIYFCGSFDKGSALLHLCEHLQEWPDEVVFIDDRLEHLHKVQEALATKNIVCHALHYIHLDEKKNRFKLIKALD